MSRLVPMIAVALCLVACAGSQPARPSGQTADNKAAGAADEKAGAAGPVGEKAGAAGEKANAPAGKQGSTDVPKYKETSSRGLERGEKPSAIKPTYTQAALKFTVIKKKDKAPISGIVIKLTGPKGKAYYTDETDAKGYAEVLVPVGQKYTVVYLSLGRRKIAAKLAVANKPRLTMRLTLRYDRWMPPEVPLVLEGVEFDSGRATLREASFAKLDVVVEYMKHKKSTRIEIAGHTDNVGNARRNKALSKRRALACRDYLIDKGIDGDRVQAVGYGAERPIASNKTEEGRQQNRRITATEL